MNRRSLFQLALAALAAPFARWLPSSAFHKRNLYSQLIEESTTNPPPQNSDIANLYSQLLQEWLNHPDTIQFLHGPNIFPLPPNLPITTHQIDPN